MTRAGAGRGIPLGARGMAGQEELEETRAKLETDWRAVRAAGTGGSEIFLFWRQWGV